MITIKQIIARSIVGITIAAATALLIFSAIKDPVILAVFGFMIVMGAVIWASENV